MVYVVDTNVVIHSRGNLPDGTYTTAPRVRREIASRNAQLTFTGLNIAVEAPDTGIQDRVEAVLDQHSIALEAADVQLLALAVERDATLLTDDYALQNACQHFSVTYHPFNDDGISQEKTVEHRCDTCGRRLNQDAATCPCGGAPRPRYTTTVE